MVLKTWLADLTKIQGVVNNIKNIDSLANGATQLLNTDVVKSLSSEINGLNLQQAQLALSTKNLTKEQLNEVLAEAGLIASEKKIKAELLQSALAQSGLSAEKQNAIMQELGLMSIRTGEIYTTQACTKEELLNMLATKGVTGANAQAIISTLGLTTANEGATLSFGLFSAATWAQVKAQLALMASNPITWIIAAAAAIYGCVKAYDALTETEKEAEEALESAKTTSESYKNSINDIVSSHRELSSSVKDIKQRYAELSQGIDSMSNKNLSLSADDYEEFLDLNSQLADLFPTLTKGYDENGNAILGLGSNIDTVTSKLQALVEQQERLAKKEILDNLEEYVNGDDNGGGQLEEIKRLEKEKKKADKLVETYGHFQDLLNGKSVSNNDIGMKEIDAILKPADLDHTKANLDDNGWNLSSLSPTELNNVKEIWKNYYGELVFEAQTAKDELTNANAEMSSEMMYWVQSLPQYISFDDDGDIQASIMNMINGIDWSTAGAVDYDGAKDVIQQLVLTPLNKMSDDPSAQKQFSSVISGLFALNIENMPARQAEEVIANYIQQIMDILNKFRPESDKLSLDDTYSMFGFSDFNDKEKTFSSSLSKIAGSSTSDMQKLSDFTKDFTISQQQAWMSATNGAKNAEEAIRKYKEAQETANETNRSTAPKSFSQAWKSLEEEDRDKLQELAKSGKLTPEALESNEKYAEILKSVGNNAFTAADKINKMVTASDQLASMKTGIQSISNVLSQKQTNLSNESTRNIGIGPDTLGAFSDDFKELDAWEEFESTLGNGTSKMEDCQKAASKLATEWVNSNNFLSQLDDTNEQYYISTLEQMGVDNAAAIVTGIRNQQLKDSTKAKIDNAIASINLGDGIQNGEVTSLGNELSWLYTASEATKQYYIQKLLANENALDTSDSVKNLKTMAEQAGYTGDTLAALGELEIMLANYENMKNQKGSIPTEVLNAQEEQIKKKKAEIKKNSKKKVKPKVDKIEFETNTPDINPNNNSPKSTTKQVFDWLERKVNVINKSLDLLKAKIENVFSAKGKNSILDEEIKKSRKLKKTYEQQARQYKKQASASANSDKTKSGQDKAKLTGKKGKKLKKLIQNGKLKGKSLKQLIATYDEPTALALQEYQDYWDKYQDARINIQSAKTQIREAKIQKHQNRVDAHDARIAQYDAEIENKTTAKDKSDLVKKKIDHTNASYSHQIAIAKKKYGKNSAQVAELRAKQKKAVRDIEIEQLQNLADEKAAQYELKQLQEANANGAKDKNKLEQESRNLLNEQYQYEIDIAKKNGDVTEEKRLQAELAEKTRNSYQKEIENIKEEYDLLIGLNEAKKSTIESKISALQANGYGITADMYKEQQQKDLDNYTKKIDEIAKVEAKLAEGNLTGDDLKKEQANLETLKQEAWACQQSWGELQQAINDLDLSKIERAGTLLEYQAEKLQYMQDILSHSDFTLSDKEIGGLTIEGLSNAAITLGQMQNNNEQIANKWKQIAKIQEQIDNGKYVGGADGAYEQINALQEAIRELEKGNYDFGDSIKSLVIDSLNSLSDALEENISKYKDSLHAQKDLFEYRKKVSQQLKSIASLEKQLSALQGDQSEEARARIQQIQMSLDEERENLKETEYDQYIQDQEEMLDTLMDDFEDFIANVTDMSVSEICKAIGNAVADNSDAIVQSIEDAFDESSKIGKVADSVDGLKETIEQIDFSTNITINIDDKGNVSYEYTDDKGNKSGFTGNKDGTITGSISNGKDKNITNSNITGTQNDIDTATKQGKQRGHIQSIINGYKDYADGRYSDLNTNHFLRYLHTVFDKMPTKEQEAALMRELGATDSEEAVRKMVFMGFPADNSKLAREYAVRKAGKSAFGVGLSGFSQGGIAARLNKVALDNGDDGWVTIQRGEAVLNSLQTKQFQKLTDNLVPLNTIVDNIGSIQNAEVPARNIGNSTNIKNVDIHLDGSNVVDADSFINTLHNPRVIKEVSNGVSSQIGTSMSNCLGIF